MHDDVGALLRACRVEVELLGGYVATAVASLDLGRGLGRALIARGGASECVFERGGEEDTQFPSVTQLYPEWAMIAMAASVTAIFLSSIGTRPSLLFQAISNVRPRGREHAAD